MAPRYRAVETLHRQNCGFPKYAISSRQHLNGQFLLVQMANDTTYANIYIRERKLSSCNCQIRSESKHGNARCEHQTDEAGRKAGSTTGGFGRNRSCWGRGRAARDRRGGRAVKRWVGLGFGEVASWVRSRCVMRLVTRWVNCRGIVVSVPGRRNVAAGCDSRRRTDRRG